MYSNSIRHSINSLQNKRITSFDFTHDQLKRQREPSSRKSNHLNGRVLCGSARPHLTGGSPPSVRPLIRKCHLWSARKTMTSNVWPSQSSDSIEMLCWISTASDLCRFKEEEVMTILDVLKVLSTRCNINSMYSAYNQLDVRNSSVVQHPQLFRTHAGPRDMPWKLRLSLVH